MPAAPRPIVQALAPERYRVQFTIGQETHDRLRRVQTLLRREIPNGDPAAIFDRALELLEQATNSRLGLKVRPRLTAKLRSGAKPDLTKPDLTARQRTPDPNGPDRAYEARIRFETDKPPSRHIPNAVRRAVWRRDEGQCAFVAATGRRCSERNFVEFHHISRTRWKDPRRSAISPFAAGATTPTRRS